MKRKLSIVMCILAVMATFLAGCGGKSKGKIIRTNNFSEPGSLDPALAQGTHESWTLEHIFEGLMKRDQEGDLTYGMAKDYILADDDVTYTFTLRDDIKWSNGDPVTAYDFEYSWKRALDPELAAEYAYQLFYLKGGEAYNTGKGSLDEVGVKALDDKTLEVVLETPTGYFLELTAFYTYFPVNKNVVESNPDWAKDPKTHVSNGPFTLTTWDHNAKIFLEKNENYYNADQVKLDGIELAIIEDENTAWQKYEGGEFDVLLPVPQAVTAELQASNSDELKIGSMVGTYYYNLNTQVKPFNNVKIRKALALALDRETIVTKIAQGGQFAATGVVPFGLMDENNQEYREVVGDLVSYHPEEAKKLFAEGLAEEGMTADDFKNFVILYNTAESHKKIAQAVQEMWRTNLGIELQLENVDFQVKLDREKAGDYHISRAGWVGDYTDPMTFIDLWFSESSFNDARFNDARYDELVLTAKSTADQKVRFDAMREAEQILMDSMPVVPVYFYTQPYVQKPYVKGVYKPLLTYPSFIYADIEKE